MMLQRRRATAVRAARTSNLQEAYQALDRFAALYQPAKTAKP